MAEETSPSSPFPGSRTPGWNDPPTLQYNTNAVNTSIGRTRITLNKRVAFPLHGTAGSEAPSTTKPTAIVPPSQSSFISPAPPLSTLMPSSTNPIAVVHPMPNTTVPRMPAYNTITTIAPVESSRLPTDAKELIMRTFRNQINLVVETSNVRREEIERRLGLVDQLWESETLSATVKEKLHDLAKAVAEKKFTEAMDTYTTLVSNHSNECATWAVALRHILLTLQPRNSNQEAATITPITVAPLARSSLPLMLVPAMPRQNTTSGETSTITSTIGTNTRSSPAQTSSAVQHI